MKKKHILIILPFIFLLFTNKILASEYDDLTDKYNKLAVEYNTLLNKYSQIINDYNELLKKYNSLPSESSKKENIKNAKK